jgi:hypothetical protein
MEVRRGRDSLLKALVASPHPLPPAQPRALSVAPAAPLPANLRFGPMSPGITTNTPFSGAVSRQPLNVAHPQQPRLGFAQADFVAPRYQQAQIPARLANVPPLLAALAGGATLLGSGSGATAAPAARAGGTVPPPPPPTAPSYPTPTQTNPVTGVSALISALSDLGIRFNPSAGGSNYVKAF